jgi:hypothetical protein
MRVATKLRLLTGSATLFISERPQPPTITMGDTHALGMKAEEGTTNLLVSSEFNEATWSSPKPRTAFVE